MKSTVIDIVSNVVVRDYIQHWWQVAMDIVNLNSDGKNKYELRREAEKIIVTTIYPLSEEGAYNKEIHEFDSIEIALWSLWTKFFKKRGIYNLDLIWLDFLVDIKVITILLEDQYYLRLDEMIESNTDL